MPVKIGAKTYKKFSKAAAAIKRKKGLSKERAAAYTAAVIRAQGIDPRTDRPITPVPTSRKKRRGRR